MIMVKFTEKEEQVRRIWLILTFCLTCASLLFNIEGDSFAASVVFGLFGSATIFTMICQCAYNNTGTGYLTFVAFTYPIGLLYSLFSLDKSPTHYLIVNILYHAVSVFYYILCIKLRRINKNAQVRMFRYSEVYNEAAEALRRATNLQELQSIHNDLIQNWPPHFISLLMGEYEAKKTYLSAQPA